MEPSPFQRPLAGAPQEPEALYAVHVRRSAAPFAEDRRPRSYSPDGALRLGRALGRAALECSRGAAGVLRRLAAIPGG
jgi:hypothetical protein